MANNNNSWKRIGGFSRTGTQNYVRTNDAAMGGTTFGSTDVSYNTGNSTLRVGNNAGVVFINGDIDMSGGPGVGAPINRVRNVRDPIADQDVATKFYVDKEILSITSLSAIQGPPGAQGPPGIGFSGQPGSDGPTGATGCTGAIGPPGNVIGVLGPTGANGGTGATGANGAAGATGPVGPIGAQGAQGTQGTQGIQGSNGTILWLNPDGDSLTNQLITDSYMLSTVPVVSTLRKIGPISVSATYGNALKMIPGNRFWNTALEVSTLAVIPSGVWALNLYANVPSNSDANQVALYAAVFMITGTTNQPSPDSLIIETKDGGDAGYYPPRAAYLPDHVKYIGRSWTDVATTLTDKTSGAVIDSTTRKLYKIEMPVEFTTLKDASGNTENVYLQLQIYIKNTTAANQTANVNLYYQTDLNTNETTYSYLQTTFGAVGIRGIPGTTGSDGKAGATGATGTAGTVGPTGTAGPTGTTGTRGPQGDRGETGPTGPAGQSNSVGRQYTVQYRSNVPQGGPTDDSDVSGSFAGNANFRFIPDPGSTANASDATTGTVVLNDLACRSVHSSFYVEDPSITGTSTRPRTFVKGGESTGGFIVLASGKNTAGDGGTTSSPATVADITHGFKLVHNISSNPPTVAFNLHDNNNKTSANIGMKFDVTTGNIIAAQDKFCVVNQTGAVGVGGMTPGEMTAVGQSGLNRALHVCGNVMVGKNPAAGATDASSAMILFNKATTTPSTAPLSLYPGVYHRTIAAGSEVTALGGATNSITTDASGGLGIMSPNFITFQTGSALANNSIVINQAGVVSVTGRANLNGPVSVGKNFAAVTSHSGAAPIMDVSGIAHISSIASGYTDNPRIKLISNAISPNADIPTAIQTTPSTANEIRGVNTLENTGFLRLTAQSPANSCIDLVGEILSGDARKFSNSVRISTGTQDRMVIDGNGNVGIGTTTPGTGVRLDISGGAARVNSGATTGTALTTTGRVGVNNAAPTATLDVTGDVKVSSTLTTGGNVGIMTASPTAPLDVTGNTILRNLVRIGSSSAPTTALDITGAAIVNSGATTSTALTTTGRVGINIAAPTVPLDVSGAARISGELNMVSNKIVNLANPTSDQDAATQFYVKAAAAAATAVGSAAQTTANTAVTNAAAAQTTANTVTTATQIGAATASAQYLYPSSGNEAAIYTGLTNGTRTHRLYVTPAGLIGIGTSAPLVLLDVRGIIYCSDRIGIGTTSPSCPLHVAVANDAVITGTLWYLKNNGQLAIGPANVSRSTSIICEGDLWCKGTHIWITSDQRIKTNIVNLNADKMMNIFRHLRPISFDFIDPMKNYNKKHFGFIAQEVNEFLPEGISLNKDVIPNNMMKADIAKPSETDEPQCFTLKPDDTDITLQYLLLTTDSPLKIDTANPYSSKDIYKFKIYGGDKWAKEHDIYIRSDYNVIDDKYTYVIGLKKEAYDVVITESTLFVYGQYVNDLHILDHDTIYTVATAALQEVDRQQQADKARIAELEATVASQQSLINDILERLKNAKI